MQRFIIVLALVLFGLVVVNPFFVVKEGERVIVQQFGKVKRDGDVPRVYPPGLHLKVPFIDDVLVLDARLQTLSSEANRFITGEKKDLLVDFYAKWKIEDFSRFYLATRGDRGQADALLNRIINNGLRTEFGSRTVTAIVSGGRDELMAQALDQAAKSASELGVKVLDVRVKTINLPEEVKSNIFDRMRSERNVVAKGHRARGGEMAEGIRAEADRRVTVLLADAQRQSLTLRGSGDAEAAKIFADAYSKDTEFFRFLRSMDAYKRSLGRPDNLMVIQPEGDFFQYFKNKQG
ncbi:MAG: protease modulator HflC [Gammaproteobacteria bacterium]|nr:protease modulator HflC [Gammaproteobacteria bacterium]